MNDFTPQLLHRTLLSVTNPNSRRKHIIALRSLFSDIDWIKQFRIPKATARVYDLPSEETLRFTLALCPYELYGLMMMYAGLRSGEACAITRKDVKGNVLKVSAQRYDNGTLTQAKTTGEVIIPNWLADRIKVMEERTVTSGQIRESFRRYGVKTGIHLSPHMLRHWYATMMVNRRINPEIARRQMRHSDLKTTLNFYAQVSKNDIDDVVKDLFER
ncbi:site-specific recombinase [Streptomyces sp. NP160]|nr:site-specific recombinase [Streptomyces sp. NP160]